MLSKFLNRAGSDAGQALVELSVGLSLLCILMLGIMEFGQIAYTSIEVSNALKAGIQYASQNDNSASDTTGITTAAKGGAPNLSGLVVTAPTRSCICADGNSANCGDTSACPNSHTLETVSISVSYTLTPIIRLPGLSRTFSISRSASQKCAE